MAVTNSETPQESPIFNFSCRLPEILDTFNLKVVCIISSKRIIITKKIYLCNGDENNEVDKGKCGSLIMMLKLVPFLMKL